MSTTCAAGAVCLGEGLRFSYDITYSVDKAEGDVTETYEKSGRTAGDVTETYKGAITSLSWTIESNMTTTTTKYHVQKANSASGPGATETDERVVTDAPVCTIEIAGAVLKTADNSLIALFETAVKGQDCYPFEATDQCATSGVDGVAGSAYVSSFTLTGETDDVSNFKATLVSVGELIEPGYHAPE